MTTITTHIGGATITVPNAELAPFVPPPQTRITAVAFKRRFTPTERIAIRAAAQANAQVYDYMDLLNSGLAVHVTDADVIAGLQALEAAGVIAAGRAAQILSAPIQAEEAPA